MAAWLEWCLLLPCCVASGLSTLTSPLSTIQSLSLPLVVVACCGCHFGHQSMVLFLWCVCVSGMVGEHHVSYTRACCTVAGVLATCVCVWLEPW